MKPIGIWELKQGDFVMAAVVREDVTDSTEELLTFKKMDGMYGQFFDAKGDMLIAGGYVKKRDGEDFYRFCDKDDVSEEE